MDASLREIDRSYLDFEFEETLSLAQKLLGSFQGAFDLALRLKDRAMQWIYVIEWAAITGTSILVSSLIWALMIRRQLYREAQSTRHTGNHWE